MRISGDSSCYNCGMDYGECACYITYAPYKNRREDELLNRIYCRRKLYVNLMKLKPRYRLILFMRFGLFGEKEHTLTQIGREVDLTPERIRQILFRIFDILEKLLKDKEVNSKYLI